MSIDVVQAVREGKGKFEWSEVLREYKGFKLYVSVFRDAMKFDDVPAMTWNFKDCFIYKDGKTIKDERRFDGVRVPANAIQLQQIADLIGGMLLTPIIIEEIWLQAGLKFDAVINTNNGKTIVATSDIHKVHERIEAEIEKVGGDDGDKLIACVGKYWCLINALTGRKVHGGFGACNFGWMWKKASGPGVTNRVQCWQRPGFAHNVHHFDPSQTIRLMYQFGRLIHPDGTEEEVFLPDIAADPEKAGLLHHNPGALTYLRQEGVEPLDMMGTITLPEVTITASPDVS